jgi:hypothetical protein
MAGKKIPQNAKAVAGNAKKAEQESKKKGEDDRKKAVAEDAGWNEGANVKKESRNEAAGQKADDAARKRREKEALLAAEEAELGQGGTKKKAPGGAKKKAKPKNDFSMLEDALVTSAEKKVKKQKEAALAKKKKEDEHKSKEPVPLDPLLANTQAMIGAVDEEQVGRNANKARMEEDASGMDAALSALKIKTPGPGGAQSQAKSAKALYNEFEERMLPEVKADYAGLRLTQYKEKVWNLWKKSPDNPANQAPKDGAPAR